MIYLICFLIIIAAIWVVSEFIGTIMDYRDLCRNQDQSGEES